MRLDFSGGADGEDASALDGDRAVFDDAARRVHGEDGSAGYDEVRFIGSGQTERKQNRGENPHFVPRKDESNARGNKSFIANRSRWSCKFTSTTGISPQNSQMIWRHAPQGGVKLSVSAATAMRTNLRWPSLSALKIAMRSAQTVS